MITIKEAEEILKKEYHIDNFLYVVNDMLLPDFVSDRHDVEFKNNIFESVNQLGYSDKCEVTIFEVILKAGSHNRRVTITQEMFKILRGLGIHNAIVAFANADKLNYRFSLLTSKYEFDGEKVVKVLSNPRRYSYSLGYGTKTKTAYDFLIGKGKVNSLDELINRFSVEVVNKQFYSEIAACFTGLVGGQRDGKTFNRELNIYGVTDQNKYAEFAVRLIGRIVFCWFLKEKKSENGVSLIPETLFNTKDIKIAGNYYHDVLEPLFFELLNTSIPRRKGKFAQEAVYNQIPYLNGGLFSPHIDDHYKFSPELQSGQYGIVTISNDWFDRFYAVLGQYNFTVDENTSYDIELSIDPEMLGRIFENLLAEINPETGENAKKSTGSYYTPRDIVDYMVDNSILEHLKTKTGISEEKLKALISYGKEDDELMSFSEAEKKAIVNALYSVTVLDPACGSGAFPIGVLQKIVYMLQEIDTDATLWFNKATENVSFLIRKEFEKKFNAGSLDYIRKLTVIQNSIFGIDIQPIAVEIARLRCFLSLVIEEKVYDDEPNRGINPLPSLDFKFIVANSLIPLESEGTMQMSLFENQEHIKALRAIREEYFNADNDRRTELKLEFKTLQQDMLLNTIANYQKQASLKYQLLSEWKPFESQPTTWFDPEWMFGIKDGFDIVIGNPPYISTKEIPAKDKDMYEKIYGFSDDTYNIFTFRGMQLVKDNGTLNYIIPKTFWTTQTKRNMRNMLLSKAIKYIYDTANPFSSVMVDTCIIQVQNKKYNDDMFLTFLDGSKNLLVPDRYNNISQRIFIEMPNSVIFTPTEYNTKISEKYGKIVKSLLEKWWDCIKTSKDIEKNKYRLEQYRNSLKPGDITLLGCLTEGGQGLATANNGKYIAIRKTSKWANNVLKARYKKLDEVMRKYNFSIEYLHPYVSTKEFLDNASELEIAKLFDLLKEKYGRDVFGQGFIYRLIDDAEIADVDSLSDDEKADGIDTSKAYYVPYDKGDKDGNRWFLETPFAIAWSKENVHYFKTNSGKKGEGMPVLRNPQFYFKEGFCWNDINTTYLKCRIKGKSVNDVKSMSLYGMIETVPEFYMVALINSSFVSYYVDSFINNTQTFQINDARQIPIIIPFEKELLEIRTIFNGAVKLKKKEFETSILQTEELNSLQYELDKIVASIYKIN